MTLSAQPRFLPTQALGTFNYYWNQPDDSHSVVRMAFAADFNSDGTDEVVFAGFAAQPLAADKFLYTRLQIFGWQGDNLVNVTSQWLPQGRDQVSGVGDLQFGDFNGDGRVDMFQAGYADMDRSMEQFVFYNRGDHFERVSFGNVTWQHAAAVCDINRDGIADIITTGWVGAPYVYLGSASGLTRKEIYGNGPFGAGIAVGNFAGANQTNIVVTDWANSGSANDSALFSITADPNSSNFFSTYTTTLPTPILESLPRQSYHSLQQQSHDIRARAVDFSGDGVDDIIVFSREYPLDWSMRVKSSVQFLENQGLGQFIDVTDQRLKNYDSNSSSAYAPVLRDFNSDGLMDIFLSDGDIGRNNSVGLLMATSDGGWIDTARILFNELVPGISVATMARGPNGHYHLVWDQGANSLGNVMSAEVRWASTEDTTNLVVDQANRVYVDFSDGVTRARDLRRAPAIQAQEDDLLDLTGLAQDLDLDLWWSGNRAPGRKVDATGAVWERGNVIYVSTDRDQKAEWWARVVGVRDLDQDDFWLG